MTRGFITVSRSTQFIERLEGRQLLSAAHAAVEMAMGPFQTITAQSSHKTTAKVAKRNAASAGYTGGQVTPSQASTEFLTAADVSGILAAAASQALPGQAIAVTDREGDVLGVYLASGGNTLFGGAAEFLAIQAANTAAQFESTQNAFTSRTARFIILDHFPVPVANTPGGPLYGVEFSEFPGADVLPADYGVGSVGYNVGLSGLPGGMPLYIDGVPVGGIGVAGAAHIQAPNADLKNVLTNTLPANLEATGITNFFALGLSLHSYLLSAFNSVYDGTEKSDPDESVALAGSFGYYAPPAIRSTNITVGGLTLPYTDSRKASGKPAQTLDQLIASGAGDLVALSQIGIGATAATSTATTLTVTAPGTYLAGESVGLDGFTPSAYNGTYTITSVVPGGFTVSATSNPGPASVLGTVAIATPVAGIPPQINGVVDGVPGLYRIRSSAAAAQAGVDVQGIPIGTTINTSDNTVNSTINSADDVISSPITGQPEITAAEAQTVIDNVVEQALHTRAGIRKPNGVTAKIHVVVTDTNGNVVGVFSMQDATNFSYDVAVQKARTAAFFSDDSHAYTSTAIGFLSQGFFPIGINGGGPGPLYRLQDYLMDNISNLINQGPAAGSTVDQGPLPDGITDFPGGDPLYNSSGQLIGAVGVSGDGVNQDDLMCYAGTEGFQPPNGIRSDQLSPADAANFLIGKVNEIASLPGVNLGNFNVTKADHLLENDLRKAKLPYVKFPRNPTTL